MKLDFKKYIDNDDCLLRDIVFATAIQFKDTVGEGSEYYKNQALDIELRINDVDINPVEFFDLLNEHVNQLNDKADREINKFKSKNSDNAIKHRIKQQMDKVYNELRDIESKLHAEHTKLFDDFAERMAFEMPVEMYRFCAYKTEIDYADGKSFFKKDFLSFGKMKKFSGKHSAKHKNEYPDYCSMYWSITK